MTEPTTSGPAIVGNTTPASKGPRRATGRATPSLNATGRRSPTWGCTAPCRTQTCPKNILTRTRTSPATRRGQDAAQRAAVEAGHVPEQQTWSGLVKPAELSHDTAVYRAALDERARIEAEGGRVTRVRIDAELKATVATETERGARRGRRPRGRRGEAHRRPGARAPRAGHRVLYPDAQLDIEDRDGLSGRVHVEIASDHYHAAAIAAKAGAGFALHGSSRSATRKIARALARETDSGPGGGAAHAGRDGSVEL